MLIRLSSVLALGCVVLSFFPAAGQPQTSSAWVQGLHSRVRLISGGRQDDRWLSGIEINLEPGFKTYWRTPGDSGLPPRFDWSGSENLESVDVKWPAPTRQEDAGGVAYAYHDNVVLPLIVKPADPTKPVGIALSVDYGVCKDICIPAHADLNVSLDGAGPEKAILEQALAALPRPQALGAPGDLSVLSIAPPTGGDSGFKVKVRAPAGSRPTLFVEGPDDWYLSTSLPDAENTFTVRVEEKPEKAPDSVPVRLTLVAGDRAIETNAKLDGSGAPR